MKEIAKIGNLTIYRHSDGLAWLDSHEPELMVTLYAYNGADEVGHVSYPCACNGVDKVGHKFYFAWNEAAALDVFMHSFDYYTLSDIHAGLVEIISEYDGALLSGKIAGFSATEYFKRVDETRFYKHFTHRPAMTAKELLARCP